jgi:hypothetical protein
VSKIHKDNDLRVNLVASVRFWHLVAEPVQELDEGLRPARSRRHAVACGEQVLGDRASDLNCIP